MKIPKSICELNERTHALKQTLLKYESDCKELAPFSVYRDAVVAVTNLEKELRNGVRRQGFQPSYLDHLIKKRARRIKTNIRRPDPNNVLGAGEE